MRSDDPRVDADDALRELIPADRQRVIEALVRERGSVRGRDLVELLGVTDETIRRDILKLAETGAVRTSRGGPVAVGPQDRTGADIRMRVRSQEELASGARTAELVEDGSRIILDSGTTTLSLARALRTKRDLTVVTTAVTHAVELLGGPGTTVVMTGGEIRPLTYGATGELAVATLREVRVDIAFLAIHSVSVKGGLTYPSFEEVATKRAMIEAASRVVLLADHSKFGREAFVKVAPITDVHTIVTSPGVDPAEADEIRAIGIEIIEAPVRQRALGVVAPAS
jgi:DeoR family fructose operon transcriptional repressor